MFKKRDLLLTIVVTMLYFASGKLGLQLAFVSPSASAIWPPTGISLAMFLLYGARVFPAIFLGAFLVNLTTTGTMVTSLGIALGNSLEGLIGSYLIKNYANGVNAFDKVKDIFKFTVLVAIFATTISATIGTITLLLGGLERAGNFFSIWATWWFGDMGGALIFTPLILIWVRNIKPLWNRKRIYEVFFLFTILLIIGELIFSGIFPYIYLSIPPLVWIAFRLSQKEAVTAIFLLSAIALLNTLYGKGPFVKEAKSFNESLLLLEIFMGTVSITILSIVAAMNERMKAQKFLENNQKYFRTLIETSSDVIELIDQEGKIKYVNNSVINYKGYHPYELVGKNIFDFVYKDDLNNFKKELKKVLRSPKKGKTMEFRLKHKNGSFIWFEAAIINNIRIPYIGAIVIDLRDISVRRQTEEMKDRIIAIVNSSKDAIFSKSLDGTILSWNKSAEKIFGYKSSEIIGKSAEVIIPKDRKEELVQILAKIKSGNQVDTYETVRMTKNGTFIPVSITNTPVRDKNGKIREISTILRDITHEKELEQRKDEFISMASHELNTPVTGLSVYIQTLQKIFEKRKDLLSNLYLSKANDQIQRTRHLIRDLLDISRIRLGLLSFNYSRFDLGQLIEEIVEVYRYLSKRHKIIFKQNSERIVFADRERIGQVLSNLLSNAIKYSPKKDKIIVKTFSDNNIVTVSVQDFGIGIAEKSRSEIFKKYYRVKGERQGSSGLGIGLYLSFQIIQKHKGRLWFESKQGKGSTFFFNLPLQ